MIDFCLALGMKFCIICVGGLNDDISSGIELMKNDSSVRGLGQARCFGIAALLVFALSNLSLFAHPGHDLGAYGAAHVITSSYHLGILALTGLLIYCVGRFIQNRSRRRLLQIGGAAMIGCAAFLWLA